MALSKFLISSGFARTLVAPHRLKYSISESRVLPVTPNMGAVYPISLNRIEMKEDANKIKEGKNQYFKLQLMSQLYPLNLVK